MKKVLSVMLTTLTLTRDILLTAGEELEPHVRGDQTAPGPAGGASRPASGAGRLEIRPPRPPHPDHQGTAHTHSSTTLATALHAHTHFCMHAQKAFHTPIRTNPYICKLNTMHHTYLHAQPHRCY